MSKKKKWQQRSGQLSLAGECRWAAGDSTHVPAIASMADDPEPTDGASTSDADSPQYRPLRGGEGRPPVESAEDSSAGATLELSPVDPGEQVVSRSSRHGRLAAKHGGSLVVG
eukprot:COSAG01_NODE_3632_length_5845_cov_9.676297_4_plen_113_part_00